MKQQSIGFVLCALLLTTFGHDVLNRVHAAHTARLAHSHSRARSPLLSRKHDDDDKKCHYVCGPSASGGFNLTVAVNSSNHILGVYNASAEVGLAIQSSFLLIFNLTANNSQGIIINYEKDTVVTLNLTKINPKIDFLSIIQDKASPESWFEKGEKASKEEVSESIQKSLIVLTGGEWNVSRSETWELVLHVAKSVSAALKVDLQVIKSGYFNATISLNRLIEIVNGFASVITQIEGGVQVIIEHNVTISLEILLNFHSTFEIAGYIWEQLSGADLIHIFHGLNTTGDILQLIAGLAENSTIGVNGMATFLSKLVLFIDGKISINIFLEVLVEFIAKNKGNTDLLKEYRAAVDSLYDLIIRLRLQEKLKGVLELLVKIRERKWIEGGVDISAIIVEIAQGLNGNALKLIIQVFICIEKKVPIEVSTAALFLHFVELLTLRGGAEVIVVIVGISINEEILNAGTNALTIILRGLTIADITGKKLIQTLKHLEVFSQIVIKIDVQLKAKKLNITVEGALLSNHCGGILRTLVELFTSILKHIEPVHPLPPLPGWGHGPVINPSTPDNDESTTKGSENNESNSSGDTVTSGPVTFASGGNIIGSPPADAKDHKGKQGKHGTHARHHQAQGKHHTHEKQNKA